MFVLCRSRKHVQIDSKILLALAAPLRLACLHVSRTRPIRSMYSHSDGSVLEYVDLGRRRRLNLDSLTWWDRWMAGPSHEEGGRQRQFAQKENRETHDEHGNNGGFNTRGMTGKQSIGQGRANAGRTLREIHRRWTGAGLREKVKGRAHNILEACSEGAWILAASSELYPFSLVRRSA